MKIFLILPLIASVISFSDQKVDPEDIKQADIFAQTSSQLVDVRPNDPDFNAVAIREGHILNVHKDIPGINIVVDEFGIEHLGYPINTNLLGEGEHTLYVREYIDNGQTVLQEHTFQVSNPIDSSEPVWRLEEYSSNVKSRSTEIYTDNRTRQIRFRIVTWDLNTQEEIVQEDRLASQSEVSIYNEYVKVNRQIQGRENLRLGIEGKNIIQWLRDSAASNKELMQDWPTLNQAQKDIALTRQLEQQALLYERLADVLTVLDSELD